jgi:hypothetical protein
MKYPYKKCTGPELREMDAPADHLFPRMTGDCGNGISPDDD